jgi:nitrogen fixation protein FixH
MTGSNRGGRHWPWIIVALLCGNAGAVALLIGYSSAGESHHVVPDYYQKAVAWDQTMAQERANLELGWSVELAAGGAPGEAVELTLTVRDRAGTPVEGAAIEIGGFHRAHAALVLRAPAIDRGGGRYIARLPIGRAGLWQLELTATRGPEVFTRTVVRDLVPPGGDGA